MRHAGKRRVSLPSSTMVLLGSCQTNASTLYYCGPKRRKPRAESSPSGICIQAAWLPGGRQRDHGEGINPRAGGQSKEVTENAVFREVQCVVDWKVCESRLRITSGLSIRPLKVSPSVGTTEPCVLFAAVQITATSCLPLVPGSVESTQKDRCSRK